MVSQSDEYQETIEVIQDLDPEMNEFPTEEEIIEAQVYYYFSIIRRVDIFKERKFKILLN